MKHLIVCNDVIYGIGDSPDAAWRDSREWLDDDAPQYHGAKCEPCSDQLAQLVKRFGGDITYCEIDGVLVTDGEAERYENRD